MQLVKGAKPEHTGTSASFLPSWSHLAMEAVTQLSRTSRETRQARLSRGHSRTVTSLSTLLLGACTEQAAWAQLSRKPAEGKEHSTGVSSI